MAQNEARVTLSAEDRFSATFAAFRRQLQQGNAAVAGFDTRIAHLGLSLGALGAGFSVAGGLAFVKTMANDLDALNDASDAVGDTVENLSALENVARRNAGGLDLVTTAVTRMNAALKDAKPDSPSAQALKAIGLEAKALRQEAPTEALRQIAVALNGYENDANKARIVQELFGKSLREVAPFLKDLAEAGRLNSTVTTQQAEEAERFNKALLELQVNASDGARALTSQLIPAINEYIATVKRAKSDGGKTFAQELSAEVLSIRLKANVANIESLSQAIEKEPRNRALVTALAEARQRYDELSRAAAAANEQLKATVGLGAPAGAGAGRGFINPPLPLPKLPDLSTGGGRQQEQVSEAQRYLETLRRQVDATFELTNVERARLEIQGGLKGLTPDMERLILREAEWADKIKEGNEAKRKDLELAKERAVQRENEVSRALSLMANTPTGQRAQLDADIELLRMFSKQFADGSPQHRQILEAFDAIRKRMDELDGVADKAADPFKTLADTIEKSMDRATDAVLDFVVEGKGGAEDLTKAFARDILRAEIEQPIRDTMKAAGSIIRNALRDISAGGGSSGIGALLGAIGSGIGGGIGSILGIFAGRANGGGVRAGKPVQVGENGPELFIPGADGTVVSNAAMRRGASGGPVYNDHRTININGPVPAEQVALFRRMLAADRQQMLRSMRTGGAFAVGG